MIDYGSLDKSVPGSFEVIICRNLKDLRNHTFCPERLKYNHDDVGIVLCSKRKLNKNKQTKILVEMHFVVYSNFSSLDLLSSRS